MTAGDPSPAGPAGPAASAHAPTPFVLRGDFIPLDALLKATGLAPSGGTARVWISDGQVQVDGRVERRKTAKIRAGQVVRLGDERVAVQGPDPAPPDAAADRAHDA
jgi:ribosome-associated protein